MLKVKNGVGEKVAVIETPIEKCDISKIKCFYEALPPDMQDNVIVLGVSNYLLNTTNNEFIDKVHKALFPRCDKKFFVRFE